MKRDSPKILYVQYTRPDHYPPLGHGAHLLAAQGWRIVFLGVGAPGESELIEFIPCPGVEIRRLPFCPPGWRQKLQYLLYGLWVAGWAVWWRPQWLYVSGPLACPVGLLLNRLLRIRTIYHEHDLPEERDPALPSRHPSQFMRWILWARLRLARCAQGCVVPNEQRAKRFVQTVGPVRKLHCVWNCPLSTEVGPTRTGHEQQLFQIVYVGSLVTARVPLAVLEALVHLPEFVCLRIMGYETLGSENYLRRFMAFAEIRKVHHRVEIRLGVTRKSLIGFLDAGDVGLSLLVPGRADANLQSMVGASNKTFEYLARGLPVLVSDLEDWRRTFVDPGYGLACQPEQPESIAGALRWLIEHREQSRGMGERGRKKIAEDWNYEKQFSPVLSQLAGDGQLP